MARMDASGDNNSFGFVSLFFAYGIFGRYFIMLFYFSLLSCLEHKYYLLFVKGFGCARRARDRLTAGIEGKTTLLSID